MKSKYVAGILALLMGMFGVHRFYLGQKALGVLYFVMAFIGIGVTAASDGEAPLALLPLAIGMIDAVLFFAMPRPDFDEKYNEIYLNEFSYTKSSKTSFSSTGELSFDNTNC